MLRFLLIVLCFPSIVWNYVKCQLDEEIPSVINSPIALILFREVASPLQTDSFGTTGRRFYDNKIGYENFGIGSPDSDLDIGSSNSNVNMNINRNDGPGLSWHKSSSRTMKGKHWKKHHSKTHRDQERQMRQIFQLMQHQLPTSSIDWNWLNPGRHSPIKRKRIPRHRHSRARRSGLSAAEDEYEDDSIEDDSSEEINTCDRLLPKILDGMRDIKDLFANLEDEIIESIDDL